VGQATVGGHLRILRDQGFVMWPYGIRVLS